MQRGAGLLSKKILAALLSGGMLLLPNWGYAMPQGGTVVAGNITSGPLSTSGNQMEITGSGNVAINWNSFDIAQNETVNFQNMQAVLNYVSGGSRSEIYGKINGAGVNVFLVNPSGILFGKTAQVNVGQLTASTRRLEAGELTGFNDSLAPLTAAKAADVQADIINLGKLTAGTLVLEGNNLSIIGADSLDVADKNQITLRANENINIGYEVTDKTMIDVGDGNGSTHQVSDYKDGSGTKASSVLSGASVSDLTGGTKSINDAMLVHDVYELQAINNNAEEKYNDKYLAYKYVHGNYMLANDIDASATSTWNDGKGFVSIGQLKQLTMGTPQGFQGGFTGVLDGAGYTVLDLSINRSDELYVGLFGGLTETAAVMNLNITGNVLGKNNVGAIAGKNLGMIRNVVNKAKVSGVSSVGGITSMNYGRLESVTNEGAVTGTGSNVGGIACSNGASSSQTGSIIDAKNTGSIKGNGNVGGIVGTNLVNSIIADASNSGEVTSTGQYTGGISGINKGSLTNIDNSGKVTGTNQVGGISGVNHNNASSSQNAGTIDKANNTGVISGSVSVGGIVGENYSNISNSINSGDVIGTLQKAGGIVGLNGMLDAKSGTIENVINTGFVTGKTFVGGIAGYNKAAKIENARNSGKVNADVDGFGQSLAGGITGYNSNSGQIFSAVNTGVVFGQGSFVGGICGASDGAATTVENAYNIGNITGTEAVGGIVGSNDNGNTLKNVYNTGTVSGSNAYGSVIGQSDNGGAITNAYFATAAGFQKYGDGTKYGTVEAFNEAFLAGMQESDKALWLTYGDKTTPLLKGLLKPLDINVGNIEVGYTGSDYTGLAQAIADKLAEQGIIIDVDKLLADSKTEIGEYDLSDLLYSTQDGYALNVTGKLIIKAKAVDPVLPDKPVTPSADAKYTDSLTHLKTEKMQQEEYRNLDKRRNNLLDYAAVVVDGDGIKLEETEE